MVLEADERARRDALDLGVDDDIADEALLAGFGSDVDHADAREPLALGGLVVVTEKLISAADGKHRRTRIDRALEGGLFVLDEVFVHERLLAVLTATEEEDVHVLHVFGGAAAQLDQARVIATPFRALEQRQDVAAVSIDVHEVGV